MKKAIGLFSAGLVLIVCILFYLENDRKGYNYGFGCNLCSDKLPYNLRPNVDRYYLFTLLDDDGFELVGSGFQYQRTNFVIKDFLGYGYNDTSVLVKCTDSLNNIKYLSSYETGYNSSKGNPEISFKDLNSNFDRVKINYHWTDLDEERGDKIRLYKTLSLIGIIISLLLIVREIFRLNKKPT